MDLKEIGKLLIALLVALVVGGGVGYYLAPDKIKIQEKVVEIEKEVVTKEREVIEKYDPVTGKLIERIVKDKDKTSKKTEEKKEKITEKEKTRKHYAVKGGAAINPRDLNGKVTPRVGVEMRLPIFDSWVGVEADVDVNRPLIGGYLRVEF